MCSLRITFSLYNVIKITWPLLTPWLIDGGYCSAYIIICMGTLGSKLLRNWYCKTPWRFHVWCLPNFYECVYVLLATTSNRNCSFVYMTCGAHLTLKTKYGWVHIGIVECPANFSMVEWDRQLVEWFFRRFLASLQLSVIEYTISRLYVTYSQVCLR